MKQRPEVSQNKSQLNSAPSGFGTAKIREVVTQAMQPWAPRPAPIRPKNGGAGPPKAKKKPGEGAILPAPQIDQTEDSTQPVIAAQAKGKPAQTIPCKVELRLALNAEGSKAPPSFGYFDRSDTFCRLAIVNLNVENPATRSALEKHNAYAARFFAGLALAKRLLRDRSALVESLLGAVKTRAGIAPGQGLGPAAFARVLARSALLEPTAGLRIFGPASAGALGRSFALAELELAIPVAAPGALWDRRLSERKGSPHDG